MKKIFIAIPVTIAILHSISSFGGSPSIQCSILLADISKTSSSSTETLKRVLRQLILGKNALSAGQVATLLNMQAPPIPDHLNFQNLSSEENFAYTKALRLLLEGQSRDPIDWPDVRKDLDAVFKQRFEQEKARVVAVDKTKNIFYSKFIETLSNLGNFVFSDPNGSPYFVGSKSGILFNPVDRKDYPVPGFGKEDQYALAPDGSILFHYDGRHHQPKGGEKILHIYNIKTSEHKQFDLEAMGLIDDRSPGHNVSYFMGQDGKLKMVVSMTLPEEAAHMVVIDIESGQFEKIEYLTDNSGKGVQNLPVFVTHAGRIFTYVYDQRKIAVREIQNPFLKKTTTLLGSYDLNRSARINGFGHHFMYEDSAGLLYLYVASKGSLTVYNLSQNTEHTFNDVNIEGRIGLEGPYESPNGDVYLLSHTTPALVGSSQVGITVFNLRQLIARNIESSGSSATRTEAKFVILPGGQPYVIISSKGEDGEISTLYFEDLIDEHNQLFSVKGKGLRTLYHVGANLKGEMVGYFKTFDKIAVVQLYGPVSSDWVPQ